MKKKKTSSSLDQKKARSLLEDPTFLFRVLLKIGELGVVGELVNGLILFLAGITKDSDMPVSVLVRGQSSSGKSSLARAIAKLFSPEFVVVRASLSAKAPAHSSVSLKGKILYLLEYRGGKDAQYLLRLQQSEQFISHEFTTVRGPHRKTEIAEREGSPVVLTTSTETKIFEDDDTRFLSIWIDDSPEQTLRIMQARADGPREEQQLPLVVWHEAIRLIAQRKARVFFPDWIQSYVAPLVPREDVRVRRDWDRFLSVLRAVAICSSFSDHRRNDKDIEVKFSDYCVAYRLLHLALASTTRTVHSREIALADAVRTLSSKNSRPVTLREVAAHLKWKESLVYKYVAPTISHNLIKEESGTRQSNAKLLLPVPGARTGFLPPPTRVWNEVRGLEDEPGFVDPLTGEWKVVPHGK